MEVTQYVDLPFYAHRFPIIQNTLRLFATDRRESQAQSHSPAGLQATQQRNATKPLEWLSSARAAYLETPECVSRA
jgi:hypothetical protein